MTRLERQERRAQRAQFRLDVLVGRNMLTQNRIIRAARVAATELERLNAMRLTPPRKRGKVTKP